MTISFSPIASSPGSLKTDYNNTNATTVSSRLSILGSERSNESSAVYHNDSVSTSREFHLPLLMATKILHAILYIGLVVSTRSPIGTSRD
jgi:hypothetical protein